MKKSYHEKNILEILNEIEEEGREEVRWSGSETEIQHGYGMMDAITELRRKLNVKG